MKKSASNPRPAATHCYASGDGEKKRILARLTRIEGQLRGIRKMVEAEAPCIEVLRQISSVSGAVRGVWTQVLGDHLRGCIAGALARDEEPLVDELVEFLQKTK